MTKQQVNSLATIGSIVRDDNQQKRNDVGLSIGLLILKLMNDLKVQDAMTKEEVKTTAGYVMEYFKDMSIDDIKKCFELIIVHGYGEIEYSTYGRFSCEYVCRFLAEHRKWKQIRNIQKQSLPSPSRVALPISEDANREVRRQLAESTYADYLERGVFWLKNADSVFSEMEKYGYCTDWDTLKGYYLSKINDDKKPVQPADPNVRTKKVGLLESLLTNNPILNAPETDINAAKKLYIQDKFKFWKDNGRPKVFINQ